MALPGHGNLDVARGPFASGQGDAVTASVTMNPSNCLSRSKLLLAIDMRLMFTSKENARHSAEEGGFQPPVVIHNSLFF
jgi:hypothetical protein